MKSARNYSSPIEPQQDIYNQLRSVRTSHTCKSPDSTKIDCTRQIPGTIEFRRFGFVVDCCFSTATAIVWILAQGKPAGSRWRKGWYLLLCSIVSILQNGLFLSQKPENFCDFSRFLDHSIGFYVLRRSGKERVVFYRASFTANKSTRTPSWAGFIVGNISARRRRWSPRDFFRENIRCSLDLCLCSFRCFCCFYPFFFFFLFSRLFNVTEKKARGLAQRCAIESNNDNQRLVVRGTIDFHLPPL